MSKFQDSGKVYKQTRYFEKFEEQERPGHWHCTRAERGHGGRLQMSEHAIKADLNSAYCTMAKNSLQRLLGTSMNTLPSGIVSRRTLLYPCSLKQHLFNIESRQYASRIIVKEPLGRSLFRAIRRLFSKPEMKTPPYNHPCQIGDPVLRGQSSPVDPRKIKTAEIQNVIRKMTQVMRSVGAVGVAAPQVGVAKQIIAMEFTKKHFQGFDEEVLRAREVAEFPLKIFINPVVKITDPRVVSHVEGCLSVVGYDACVPRAYGVEITGFNENGVKVSWSTSGYPARIIQHEVDHLRGRLFVDIMDSSTFMDRDWPKWNFK